MRLAQCRRACAHGTTVDCALSFLLARHFCVNCGRCVCEKLTIRRPPHCVCKQGQRLPSPPSHLTQPRHSPPSASLIDSAPSRPAGHNGLPMPPLMAGCSSSRIAREPAQHQQHQAMCASPPGHFRVGPASVDSDSEQAGLLAPGQGRCLSPQSGGLEGSQRLAIMSMHLNDRYASAMTAIRMYDAAMLEVSRGARSLPLHTLTPTRKHAKAKTNSTHSKIIAHAHQHFDRVYWRRGCCHASLGRVLAVSWPCPVPSVRMSVSSIVTLL